MWLICRCCCCPASGGLLPEARRALQSCEAVAVAQRSSAAHASLGMTVYLAAAAAQEQVQVQELQALVAAFQSDPSSVEQRAAAGGAEEGGDSEGSDDGSGEEMFGGLTSAAAGWTAAEDIPVDTYLQAPHVPQPLVPPVLYVTVPALPRACLLEVQPLCVDVTLPALQPRSGSSSSSDDEQDDGPAGGDGAAAAGSGGEEQGAGSLAAPVPGLHCHVVHYGGKLLQLLLLLEGGGSDNGSGSTGGSAMARACQEQLSLHGMEARHVVSARLYRCKGDDGAAAAGPLCAALEALGLTLQAVPVLGISCSAAPGTSFAAAVQVTVSLL